MALGAGKARVIFLVLREMGLMMAAGMAVGALLTAFLTRFVASRLYSLSALDPLTIFLAVSILVLVAAVAGYFPAWRAARVNPMKALRYE
jgi:putative ABC transport system permease protein